MGVSGCGKTTVGQLLAKKIDLPFYDADDFHDKDNIKKMSQGIPLDDKDRIPWLKRLSNYIREWNINGGAVLACSALKESYRECLTQNGKNQVKFIWLEGDRETILKRMQTRDGHFMPHGLLDSQLATLERPAQSQAVSILNTPEQIIETIIAQFSHNS